MAVAERRAEATWEGNLFQGSGRFSVGSGAMAEQGVSWPARTERSDGKTSPEELIAAAHATCFSMALSNGLDKRGTPPERLDVEAVCTLDRVDGKLKITRSDIRVRGRVPGIDAEEFRAAAEEAKDGCPVSGALRGNLEMTVDAQLENE